MNGRTSHAEWKTLAVEASALAAQGELGQAIEAGEKALAAAEAELGAITPPSRASSPTWPCCTRPPGRTCRRPPSTSGRWQPGARRSGERSRRGAGPGEPGPRLPPAGPGRRTPLLSTRRRSPSGRRPSAPTIPRWPSPSTTSATSLAAGGRYDEALALYERGARHPPGRLRRRPPAGGPQPRPHRRAASGPGRLRRGAGRLPGGSRRCARSALGAGDPAVAVSLQHLADLDAAAGDTAKARAGHQQAIDLLEAAAGPEDLRLAASLEALAGYLIADDKQADAQPLLERALAIKEKHLGPVHPDVAVHPGRPRRPARLPRPHHRRAVELRAGAAHPPGLPRPRPSRWWPPASPRWASSTGPAASTRWPSRCSSGPSPSATRSSSADDPDLAKSLADLAELYYVQGRYAAAEPLYERAIAIKEKVLGPDDPEPGAVPQRPGGAVLGPGALRGRRAALQAVSGHLGEEPGTGASRRGHQPGQPGRPLPGAGPLRRGRAAAQARAGHPREGPGPEHEHVATSLENLAELYRAAGPATTRPSRSTCGPSRSSRRAWAQSTPRWR